MKKIELNWQQTMNYCCQLTCLHALYDYVQLISLYYIIFEGSYQQQNIKSFNNCKLTSPKSDSSIDSCLLRQGKRSCNFSKSSSRTGAGDLVSFLVFLLLAMSYLCGDKEQRTLNDQSKLILADPNLTQSHQRLSPNMPCRVIAQSPEPIYSHGKAYLSKQTP